MADDMAALHRSRCVTMPTTSPCSSTGRCRSCLVAIRSSTARMLSLRSTTSMSFDIISPTCMPSPPLCWVCRSAATTQCCLPLEQNPCQQPESLGRLLYGLPCARQHQLRLGTTVLLLTLCHGYETRCQAPSRLRNTSSMHVIDA